MSRLPRLSPPVLCAALIGAAVVTLALTDPARCAWMPKCPVRLLTGYACPGCGLQRAVHALLCGRAAEAWAYNALLPLAALYVLAVAAAGCCRTAGKGSRFRRIMLSPALTAAMLSLLVLWGIVRNVWEI